MKIEIETLLRQADFTAGGAHRERLRRRLFDPGTAMDNVTALFRPAHPPDELDEDALEQVAAAQGDPPRIPLLPE